MVADQIKRLPLIAVVAALAFLRLASLSCDLGIHCVLDGIVSGAERVQFRITHVAAFSMCFHGHLLICLKLL